MSSTYGLHYCIANICKFLVISYDLATLKYAII